MDGSRYTPTPRTRVTLLSQVLVKRTRIGTQKKMEVMPSMVSNSPPHCPCDHSNQSLLDTEKANAGPSDPLAALEKSTDAQTHLKKVQVPRLESLQDASEHYNSDPYALSVKVRKRFRAEKKVEREKAAADDQIKGRYGLPETLTLIADDEEAKEEARDEWRRGRRELEARENGKRRRLTADKMIVLPTKASSSRLTAPASRSKSLDAPSNSSTVASSLRARLLANTARQPDPFGGGSERTKPSTSRLVIRKPV